jgi:peptidoglycan/xylan/chitin deacetylase (PgdA/CDA1 family)
MKAKVILTGILSALIICAAILFFARDNPNGFVSGGIGAELSLNSLRLSATASATTGGFEETMPADVENAREEGTSLPTAQLSSSTVPNGLVTHGSRTRPEVALTFDACEINSAGYDAGVVNDLLAAHAPATMFLGGKWMLDHSAATHALAQVPYFELANHSFNHPHFARLTAAQINFEVTATQKILFALTGRVGHYFRFPYGEYTSAALAEVTSLGLTAIQWDDVSGDPSPKETTASEIAQVLRNVHDGSIIIMHMNGRGWHTAAALPTIIAQLRARGFTLVTMSQLLADSQSSALAATSHGAPRK